MRKSGSRACVSVRAYAGKRLWVDQGDGTTAQGRDSKERTVLYESSDGIGEFIAMAQAGFDGPWSWGFFLFDFFLSSLVIRLKEFKWGLRRRLRRQQDLNMLDRFFL